MDANVINQYDLVEVIEVPEKYAGVIDIGDVGVVVEKYDDQRLEVECIQSGGSSKWSAALNIENVRLKSKDPFMTWASNSLVEQSITKPSIKLGAFIGLLFGALMGAGLGAITKSLNGILIGLVIGLILGVVTGALTAALTVQTAGTTGGVGVGYFTGMLFGGAFGMILGVLAPTPLRMSAHTQGMPILDALMMGRFETAIMLGFTLSILDTIVGVWIGGKNQVPRNLKERYRS
jgi:hypothetical protein